MGGGGGKSSLQREAACLLWDPISGGGCLQNEVLSPRARIGLVAIGAETGQMGPEGSLHPRGPHMKQRAVGGKHGQLWLQG